MRRIFANVVEPGVPLGRDLRAIEVVLQPYDTCQPECRAGFSGRKSCSQLLDQCRRRTNLSIVDPAIPSSLLSVVLVVSVACVVGSYERSWLWLAHGQQLPVELLPAWRSNPSCTVRPCSSSPAIEAGLPSCLYAPTRRWIGVGTDGILCSEGVAWLLVNEEEAGQGQLECWQRLAGVSRWQLGLLSSSNGMASLGTEDTHSCFTVKHSPPTSLSAGLGKLHMERYTQHS